MYGDIYLSGQNIKKWLQCSDFQKNGGNSIFLGLCDCNISAGSLNHSICRHLLLWCEMVLAQCFSKKTGDHLTTFRLFQVGLGLVMIQ